MFFVYYNFDQHSVSSQFGPSYDIINLNSLDYNLSIYTAENPYRVIVCVFHGDARPLLLAPCNTAENHYSGTGTSMHASASSTPGLHAST